MTGSGTESAWRGFLNRLNDVFMWLTVGVIAIYVVLAGFLLLVYGTNWLTDAAVGYYGDLPELGKSLVGGVTLMLVALVIGRKLTRGLYRENGGGPQ